MANEKYRRVVSLATAETPRTFPYLRHAACDDSTNVIRVLNGINDDHCGFSFLSPGK
jgi:hypothetical protein